MRHLILTIVFSTIGVASYASDCQVPGLGRGGDWVKIQELTRAFRCIIAEINELKRQQKSIVELERTVADLQRRVPTEYVNDNGQISSEAGRLVGKATFIVDSSQSRRPFSLPIAQDVLENLCDGTSCQIQLTMTTSGALLDTTLETRTVGPCGFNYNASTGGWNLNAGCTGVGVNGTDGDGVSAATRGRTEIVMAAGKACLFTDGEVRFTPGQTGSSFGPDRSKGFYVVSAPDRRRDLQRRFQCVLEVFRVGLF